jgi:hypothetical protein
MDIVKRLQAMSRVDAGDPMQPTDTCNDAVEEIQTLRADLEEYKLKIKAAYKREAKWIENISLTKDKLQQVTDECRKNELRHGEMIESLVNALARYEGDAELLKDARTYLEIIFEGHTSSKTYTDYKEWHKQRMDGLYEAYMSRARESRGK